MLPTLLRLGRREAPFGLRLALLIAGAHVDPELDKQYLLYHAPNSLGWEFTDRRYRQQRSMAGLNPPASAR